MSRRAVSRALGLVLLTAGLAKLALQPAELAYRIDRFALFPPLARNWLAVALPWVEVLAGLGLLRRWPGAQWLAAFLCGGFCLVVGWALVSGQVVDCGCLGPAMALVGWPHFLVNVGLLVASLQVGLDWRQARI